MGVAAGIPMLGLDALGSAAYGPEAALTLLIPLGAGGVGYIGPISTLIVVLLMVVYFSYRQTIAAYPQGGGSYTVAKENLGTTAGLFAAAALLLDYVLVVAVGVSAGVGALVSALPDLQPHTLSLCLAILLLITIVNLRGVRESGLAFMAPTYLFIICLLSVLAIGVVKTVLAGGHPVPVEAPAALPEAARAASLWILMRAFASGCTAMTGVEAVSNGVTAFREPAVRHAQRTLTAIIGILAVMLAGIAYLCHVYTIGATEPGQTGYQSILSQLVAAVIGRGVFYYITIGSVLTVLALSANTGFADFPRLCRVIAADGFLPSWFCTSRAPAGLLAGYHRPGGALGGALDRVWRNHRSSHPAVCDRRLSGFHAVASGDGRAFLAVGRSAREKVDGVQRRGGCLHRGDALRRPDIQISRRRLDHDSLDTGAPLALLQCARTLPEGRTRSRQRPTARRRGSKATGRAPAHSRLECHHAEGDSVCAVDLARDLCTSYRRR